MSSTEPQQVFVRNDKGRLWGPITPQTLELLLENGLIEGRIQLSLDGLNFAFPGRFAELREYVPPELWGDGTPAPAQAPAAPPPPAAAGPIVPPPPGPRAGPGARPPPVLRAGPGAVQAAQMRGAPAGQRHPASGIPVVTPAADRAAAPHVAGIPGPPVLTPKGAHAPMSGAHAAAPARAPGVPGPPVLTPQVSPAPAPGVPAAGPPRAPAASATAAAPAPAPARDSAPAATPTQDAVPASGELATYSPIRLYYLAASTNQTGRLTLKFAERRIDIHFRKGNPEHVASDHPEDALGGFLLRERLATEEQLAQAEAARDRFGGDLVAALFGTGTLHPATAFTHLSQRAHALLLKALLAENGSFEFVQEDLPAHKAMPLGNRWSVLMDQVRRVPPLLIRHRLASVADNPVMKSGGQVQVADLRLTPQEARAMGYIDGVRSLNLLARDMPQDADVFFRLAWALRDMDIVSFAAVKLPAPEAPKAAPAPGAAPAKAATPPPSAAAAPRPASAPPRPAAAPVRAPSRPTPPRATPAPVPRGAPSAPTATAAPSAPADYPAEIKSLAALAAKMKEQNHFEVLGLTEKADGNQVKIAYFKLAKQFHPDTVPPDAPAELGRLKAEIFAKVGEAYRTLSDDKSRASYIEDLKAGGGGEVDVAAILHAEELFQKGCILVKAKKFPEAVEMLTDAINTNAEEGEFYAWRGIARFFASADKKQGQVEADRDFATALKKNPRCAPAWFFQGQMAKLLGDSKKALQMFQKTLELQPDHLDAQREIRYLKK